MSVNSSDASYHFEDSEFPELNMKEAGRREKGRRNAHATHAVSKLQVAGLVVKQVEDPNCVLGKKRRERLASDTADGMAANVPYSMNKANRWEEMTTSSLLEAGQDSQVPVYVVDQTIGSKNVTAIHSYDQDGEVKTISAKGKGCAVNSLLAGPGENSKKGRRSHKNTSEEEDTPASSAKIVYNVLKPNTNRKSFKTASTQKKSKKTRHQKINLDDFEQDEMDVSVHLEEAVYKPSRDNKFNLADYMVENDGVDEKSLVYVKRPSIEVLRPMETETEKPFDLLDISGLLREPMLFEELYMNTSKWSSSSNFDAQVSEMQLNSKLDVKWLDNDNRRVAIDASQWARNDVYVSRLVVIVMEKVTIKNHVRMIVNSAVAPASPQHGLQHLLKDTTSMRQAVEAVGSVVGEWSAKIPHNPIDKPKVTRFDFHKAFFHPAVNSKLLAMPSQLLTVEKMTELVREEGIITESDSFERIDTDDFDGLEDAVVPSVEEEKISCDICGTTKINDLFELDECWQCRDCLKQKTITMIRAGVTPLELPLVMRDGHSTYDVLPAIIPLNLITFYTKMCAKTLLTQKDVDVGDLTTCPSCKHVVIVDTPSEYNSYWCTNCSHFWCLDCLHEPHYPLSCEQYVEWSSKWIKQYNLHVLLNTKNVKKITCACGTIIEASDAANHAECDTCGRQFDPRDLRMLDYHFWTKDVNGAAIRRTSGEAYLQSPNVEVIPVSKIIKKDITEICGQARKMRLSTSCKTQFEKKTRVIKESCPAAETLRELRKAVLAIVENGLGLVYVKKDKELDGLKNSLVHMHKNWLDLELALDNQRSDITTKIISMENQFYRVLEMLNKM